MSSSWWEFIGWSIFGVLLAIAVVALAGCVNLDNCNLGNGRFGSCF